MVQSACPSVWYKYDQTAHECQCIALTSLTCDGEHVYADILTYNVNKKVITEIKMRHQYLRGYNTMGGGFYVRIFLYTFIEKFHFCY